MRVLEPAGRARHNALNAPRTLASVATLHRPDAEQRAFFDRAAKFFYANPYSADRGQTIKAIPEANGLPANRDPYAIAAGVAARLNIFDVDGLSRLHDFSDRDRDGIEAAFAWLA
jgi:hypothetical protein